MRGLACFATILLSSAISFVWALPQVTANWTDLPTPPGFGERPLFRRSLSDGVQLRILPLGASIVWGYLSSDGNGFRYGIRNQLVYDGNPVNMIGSLQQGTMEDNDVEGWEGYVITQVAEKAELSIPSQPNLVLLHVGLNDMGQNIDVGNAHNRLGALIDRLFTTIPGVTIIASTLLPNANAATQRNINVYNANIPGMVEQRQAAGKKITYVDFSSSWFSTADLQAEGSHPTDAGYLKMAAVWHQGIVIANGQGWLTPPATVSGVSDTITSNVGTKVCDKIPGDAIGPIQMQAGSGRDDGPYTHSVGTIIGFSGFDNPKGILFGNPVPEGVYWADIDGDGIDDYVYVPANSNLGIGVALSLGAGKLGPYLYIPFAIYCDRSGVEFADITGDGRDDFCCISSSGDLSCWENGPGADARSPVWTSMGLIKPNEGFPRAQVRLADIDGDGRADYVTIEADGVSMHGWRNGAVQAGPPGYWTKMNGVANDMPAGRTMSGWRFVDLNGDHRDDLIWISANGQVTTWINKRGYVLGLTPVWISMGVTHTGFSTPQNITFGASMGSGRADYTTVELRPSENVLVTVYENLDIGGKMSKGDGSRYCDMTGDGSDDYIWISSVGEMTVYGNRHVWGTWDQYDVVYNIKQPRRDIHFADFDGDGLCDILLVDEGSGATTVLKNSFSNGKFTFTNIGVVTGSATCTEGYGYERHDNGVIWKDLDGDGRADFLCMQPNGVLHGYLNKGIGNMVNQNQIKFAEGKERKNMRIADIDGDGRADLLWLDMITGEMIAWHNNGPIPSSGSSWNWVLKGTVATGGTSRGSTIELPNLYGLGRGDYLSINPQTNQAWVYFNVCPGGGGTVPPTTPNLPTGAPPAPLVLSGSTTLRLTTDGSCSDFVVCGYWAAGSCCSNSICGDSCGNTCTSGCLGAIFSQRPADCTPVWDYDCITCDPNFSNPNLDVTDLWTYAGANNFANSVILTYFSEMAGGFIANGVSMEQWIPWVYGGPQVPTRWNCGEIGDTAGCDDGSISCTSINMTWPQVGLLMASWSNMHAYFTQQYTAIGDASEAIGGQISNFQLTFAPEQSESSVFDTITKIFDAFDIIFGLTQLKIWENILKTKLFDKFSKTTEKVGSLKDDLSSVVTAVQTLAEAQKPGVEGQLAIQNTLNDYLQTFVRALQNGTSNYLAQLFAEDGSGKDNMLGQLTDGKWFGMTVPSTYNFSSEVETVLYSRMIPLAWTVNQKNHPVVIVMDTATAELPLTVSNDFFTTFVNADDAQQARTEYEGKTLWLMDAHDCTGPTLRSCTAPIMYPLNGLETLNGTATSWFGLEWTDIAISSYTGYVANGNKNGGGVVNYGIAAGSNQAYSQGFATPGLYTIPVCDVDTIAAAWVEGFGKTDRCDFYPCC